MGSLFYATFEMQDPEILSALLPSNANPQPLAVATNQLASLARRQYKEIVVAFRNFTNEISILACRCNNYLIALADWCWRQRR
jgi:hypothetical protein